MCIRDSARPPLEENQDFVPPAAPEYRNGHAGIPVSLLPQRNPGASGISDIPSAPIGPAPEPVPEPVSEWPQEWPADSMPAQTPAAAEPGPWPAERRERPVPANTSSFFAAREQVAAQPASNGVHRTGVPNLDYEPVPEAPEVAGPADRAQPAPAAAAGDSIFEKMLSEWLIDDPNELAKSTDLDWQTVWDHGWSAAAAAEEAPVAQHTEHGLPMRTPGERLVPGAAGNGENGRNGGAHRGSDGDEAPEANESTCDTGPIAIPRDPESVRRSIGNHFGGVHAGRSHARDSAREGRETDQE